MIPITLCEYCQENMPVLVEDYTLSDKIVPVIFCPKCENILNTNENIRLTYIEESEISKYTNWRLADELPSADS